MGEILSRLKESPSPFRLLSYPAEGLPRVSHLNAATQCHGRERVPFPTHLGLPPNVKALARNK